MIFDTHCHLFDDQFKNDIDNVIQNAINNNVTKMLVLSDCLETMDKTIDLIKKHNSLYGALGIFPMNCYDLDLNNTMQILKEKIISNNKIKAIGEIGLDYYWEKNEENKKKQRDFFIAQLNLANELNLPVCIHARDSIEDVYNILKDNMPSQGAIMHCFSSSKEMMEKFIKLNNCYIALGGTVTFKNARVPKEVALNVPLDYLLVETDSPYLAPTPHRGERNEPSFITNVVSEIAILKKLPYEEIARITHNNALKILRIEG